MSSHHFKALACYFQYLFACVREGWNKLCGGCFRPRGQGSRLHVIGEFDEAVLSRTQGFLDTVCGWVCVGALRCLTLVSSLKNQLKIRLTYKMHIKINPVPQTLLFLSLIYSIYILKSLLFGSNYTCFDSSKNILDVILHPEMWWLFLKWCKMHPPKNVFCSDASKFVCREVIPSQIWPVTSKMELSTLPIYVYASELPVIVIILKMWNYLNCVCFFLLDNGSDLRGSLKLSWELSVPHNIFTGLGPLCCCSWRNLETVKDKNCRKMITYMHSY